jgi:predicted nucleic acid-binding protein
MREEGRLAVSDTSPLQYLHQLGLLDILPELYAVVAVPEAVKRELLVGCDAGVALPDLDACPWVTVQTADATVLPALPTQPGPGEREALALAGQTPGAVLLTDDRQARRCAELLGLRVSGTLGVLLRAKRSGLVAEVRPLLKALDRLGFRLAPETRAQVLVLTGEAD